MHGDSSASPIFGVDSCFVVDISLLRFYLKMKFHPCLSCLFLLVLKVTNNIVVGFQASTRQSSSLKISSFRIFVGMSYDDPKDQDGYLKLLQRAHECASTEECSLEESKSLCTQLISNKEEDSPYDASSLLIALTETILKQRQRSLQTNKKTNGRCVPTVAHKVICVPLSIMINSLTF
jgi:hypothetical protein